MTRPLCCIVLLQVVTLYALFVKAQLTKNYVITSIDSHVFITKENLARCGWRVEEIVTYNFTGSYYRVGRSIPYVNSYTDVLPIDNTVLSSSLTRI